MPQSQPEPFIERFIRSIKEECLDRVIPLGETHPRELIREYIAHYHDVPQPEWDGFEHLIV